MKDSKLKRCILKWYYWGLSTIDFIDEKYTNIYIKYCPIKKNKIVFDNFLGRGYGDNPKYIAEEILRQGLAWELVWISKEKQDSFPSGIRVVPHGSHKAMREWASAKVWISNVRNTPRPEKKNGQVYLQTWHGGIGFKFVEGAVEEKLGSGYIIRAKRDGRETDAIISACREQDDEFTKHFWLSPKTEILKIGQPRLEPIFRTNTQDYRSQIRNEIGIQDDVGVVLYAPTFRDDRSIEAYNLDLNAVVAAFEKKHNRKFVLLVKLHPNMLSQRDLFTYRSSIVDMTCYPDIQKLYLISDYLISDYSSASFDFSLLNKPVLLYVPDYNHYMETRGLSRKLEDTPFDVSYSENELLKHIETFSLEKYIEKYTHFKNEEWGSYDDGNASEKCVCWLKEKVNDKQGRG